MSKVCYEFCLYEMRAGQMIETYWRLIEIIFDSVQVRRDGVLHSNLQLLQFHELLPLEKKNYSIKTLI